VARSPAEWAFGLGNALKEGETDADIAMDGLPIPAVTMTDVKNCELALRATWLLNEAAFRERALIP
jgi:hypothetical protein